MITKKRKSKNILTKTRNFIFKHKMIVLVTVLVLYVAMAFVTRISNDEHIVNNNNNKDSVVKVSKKEVRNKKLKPAVAKKDSAINDSDSVVGSQSSDNKDVASKDVATSQAQSTQPQTVSGKQAIQQQQAQTQPDVEVQQQPQEQAQQLVQHTYTNYKISGKQVYWYSLGCWSTLDPVKQRDDGVFVSGRTNEVQQYRMFVWVQSYHDLSKTTEIFLDETFYDMPAGTYGDIRLALPVDDACESDRARGQLVTGKQVLELGIPAV